MYWSAVFLCQDSRQQFYHTSDGGVQPWPIKLNLDYLSLDFNSASPSPVQKVRYNQITTALICVLQYCTNGALDLLIFLKWTTYLTPPKYCEHQTYVRKQLNHSLRWRKISNFYNQSNSYSKGNWLIIIYICTLLAPHMYNVHIHGPQFVNQDLFSFLPPVCPTEALSLWWAQSGLCTGRWEEDSGTTKHQNGVEGCAAVKDINGKCIMGKKRHGHLVSISLAITPAKRTLMKGTKNILKALWKTALTLKCTRSNNKQLDTCYYKGNTQLHCKD